MTSSAPFDMKQILWHMRSTHHIHFVGIGGAGMSGIAEVILTQGYRVSGSDVQLSVVTERLSALSATIYQGHDAGHVANADVVVYSSAVDQDNPEIIAAHQLRIPVISRAEMLAELMRFRYGIAVAGTHGKTTTTSLISSLLSEGGLDPTFVIGGKLNSAGSHARLGSGRYLVAEADESDASFLRLQPMVVIVTNIDRDHMATYEGDFAKLQQAFIDFIHHLPFYGLAVLCVDDPVVRSLLPAINRPYITYGFHETADVRACDYRQEQGCSYFNLARHGVDLLPLKLRLPGRHNVCNALAALVVALEEHVDEASIQVSLERFSGIGRRFQIYEGITIGGCSVTLIDDYGHHPSEIKATLNTLREGWPLQRLVTVFQPHRFTRTHDLFDDFVNVLSDTDRLIMLDIYAAGESSIAGADCRDLCRSIRQRGRVDPIFVADNNDLPRVLAEVVNDDDILLLQGAGNIGQVAAQVVAQGATAGENCQEKKAT